MTSDSKTTVTSDDVTPDEAQADVSTETTSATQSETSDADGTSADAPTTDTTSEAPVAAKASGSGKASGGFAAGAVAIVSAGLGLVSITGSSLGDMMRFRQEILGQIQMRSGGGADQIEIAYGAPWDTTAIVNGAFALLAVLVGGAVLAVHANKADTSGWVKAVALGGALLGVLGLGVAGGMYLDLFGSQPTMPPMPAMPGAGG
ncbi:MAG: hypothetical protein GEV04_16615 [Actinophytocola sp.]|nr:hypothetical protein [Actinophytocola sp.]